MIFVSSINVTIINNKMSKKVYISADYDWDSGDRNVVDELNKWGSDN